MIDGLMVRHDQVGFFADFKSVWPHVNASVAQGVYFPQQNSRIDHDTVSDRTRFFLQNTGWNQVADKLFPAHDDGMTGIVAALKAHHHVGRLCQQVHDFAFPFIPPLGSDNDYVSHAILL
jgi:hypothetical protein